MSITFQTPAEYQAALDTLIASARWRIRIYDHSLKDSGLDSRTRYEVLRAFCMAGGGRRIEILLDETDWVERHCPLLMQLLRDFSHVLEIRQAEAGSERPESGFALANREIVLIRADKAALRGVFDLSDPARAALLHQQFDHLWERAPTTVSASKLGLG